MALPSETIELIARAQRGEQVAYERLFTRYYPRVLRIVRARMGRSLERFEDAEDIVQMTFIEAIRKLGSFEAREDAGLINWFARLVEHQIQNAAKYHGAQKRDHRREAIHLRIRDGLESGELQLEPAANETGLLDRVQRSEQKEMLDACLSQLSEEHREVIVMRDLAGASWQWIASEIGRPSPEAARELHRRARLALMRVARPRLGP